MALTAQASPLLLTSDADAAAAVRRGVGIFDLAWLAFLIIRRPAHLSLRRMAKLNRIIQNTRTAAESLYKLDTVARQEFEKPPIQP